MLDALVLALMLRTDPVGDAVGAGTLLPPTAAVFADVGAFDLTAVEVLEEATWTVRLSFASRVDSIGTSTGLGVTIADVYLDTGPGGATTTLPGVDLVLPRGLGWEVAFRVHADEAHAVVASGVEGGQARWESVDVTVADRSVTLRSQVPRTAVLDGVYAATGVYDPFSADGWRSVTATPSPWAFSSPLPAVPVVDVLATNGEAQASWLIRGLFPPTSRTRPTLGATVAWSIVMVLGTLVASVGVALRFHDAASSPVWPASQLPWRVPRPGWFGRRDELPWIEAHEVEHLGRPTHEPEHRDAAAGDADRDAS